jgi:phosphoribosylformimino-5-aminoimidazole carboxamide ribotide isomerase
MEIIPAIDLIGGKCVRLTRGEYSSVVVYDEEPLDVARRFEDAGLRRLHLVDLDGARQKKVVNLHVLERIASGTGLRIDFGGGIQSEEDLLRVFEAGAGQVTGGSIAVRDPGRFEEWLTRFGPERIILGADVRGRSVAVGAWTEDGGVEVTELIGRYHAQGLRYVISTDVARDGALEGPSFDLYSDILAQFPDLRLIASGGVSGVDDLRRLAALPLHGVIVGKAFYEGRISMEQLTEFTG